MQAVPHYDNENDLSRHKCFIAAMTILAAVASALHTIAVGRGIIWTDKVGTAATDGVFIYISPTFFMGLPNDFQRAFIIGHETLHIVLQHMFRGRLFRERGYFNHQLGWCHRTYNAAADYIINAMLIKMGLEMPECGLISDEFTADDVAEEVYVRLYQQPEDDESEDGEQGDDSDDSDEDGEGESDDEGDSGEGAESDDSADSDEDDSGSGQGDDEGDEPDQDDEGGGEGESTADESTGEPTRSDHDGHDEHLEPKYEGTPQEQEQQEREDSAEIQREIDQAVEQAEREGQDVGNNLRGATSQGDHKVDPLDDNWDELLENYLIAKAREGNDDWSRINRRKFSVLGVVAPSKKGSLKRLALIKDISWSVSDRSRALFDAKIAELLDQITPAEGTLVLHTTDRVEKPDDVYSGDEYLSSQKLCGGGTHMSAGLDWMEENGEYADLTICFTDSDVSRDDLAQLAEAGVLIVLDSYSSYVSAKGRLEASGIEFIVVNDRPA